MTREEQIRKYAEEKCVSYDNIGFDDDVYSLVVETIEWADKHPKKGMVNIDKVCEWLRSNVIIPELGITFNENEFRKAMEE